MAVLMARALHRAGYTVYTADSVTPTLGEFSRFVAKELPLPPARGNAARYAESLVRYVDRFEIREIYPTSEEIFHLAQPTVREPLEAVGAKLCAAPLETLARFHSKHEFARFAVLHGLDVPETRRLTHPADWGGIDYARDGILKREFSRFGLSIVPLFGTWNDRQKVAMGAVEKEGSSGWIWQRWIHGAGLSSYAYCVDGVVRAFCAYRTPYRTAANGAGVYCEPVDAPELAEATRKLAEATRYTGHLALDAIREAATGTLYLIECNPRATMGLALVLRESGFVDVLRPAESGAQTDTTVQVEPYSKAAQSTFGNLLYGWRYRDVDRNLLRWFREVLKTPDVLATEEPRFWWAQIYLLGRYANQAQQKGLHLFNFSTHDIEWNGEGTEFAPPDGRPETYKPTPLSFENTNPETGEPPVAERLPRSTEPEPTERLELPRLRRPALFTAFPELETQFAWSPLLNSNPAPVEKLELPGIEADLWVKRDDLCDGRYGGNKARKFEWILGDLLSGERREMVTFGELCSNHCVAAAVYGRAAGVRTRLCFVPSRLDAEERDLIYLQAFLGAEQQMLAAEAAVDILTESSRTGGAYVVPSGGSSRVGILGYVDAGLELANQVRNGSVPRPDLIYISSASRGTVLGLSMGLYLSGLTPVPRILPVESVAPLWQQTRFSLAAGHRKLYDQLRTSLPDARALLPEFEALVPPGDSRFEDLEPGKLTPELTDALEYARTIPALHLDKHYSGKAFAALLTDLRAGGLAGKTVLFWQTHGRAPEHQVQEARRLAAANALHLPPDVRQAVEENLV